MRISIAFFVFCCYNHMRVMTMTLKELRKQKKLTQAECAAYLGMPLRTYQNYENDPGKSASMKYRFMTQQLEQYGFVDEEHGVLSLQTIRAVCAEVLAVYDVEYAYLFGSYAKGTATETSDVDLLLSTSVRGITYYELVETLREKLKKKTDVLNLEQLENNAALVNEILRDGIRIYG